MRAFRDRPIRQKLSIVIMLTSSIAITLASALIIGYQVVTSRFAAVYELATLAEIIRANSASDLEMRDAKAVAETLASLKARPEIIAGRVFDATGALFAQYLRADANPGQLPSGPLGEGNWFHGDRLLLSHRVTANGRLLGTVTLFSDRQEQQFRLRYSITIVAILMAAAVCLAVLLGARLQRPISAPLQHLADVTRQVTAKKNYALRATKQGADETGVLIDAFNGMLAQIQESEAALTLQAEIARNLEEGVALTRARDATIVYANPKFDRMFGYAPGELLGKPSSILDTGNVDGPSETTARIIEHLNREGTWSGEVRNVRKDGTEFWCSANVATFDHPHFGTVWISVHADITERKRAEQRLRDAENRLRLLVEQVPAITYTAEIGPMGRWHYVSPQVEPLLGFETAEWLNNPSLWLSRIHPEDRETALAAERESLISGRFSADYRMLARDGHEVWVRDEGALVRGEDGSPDLIQGVIQDITDRKRLEREILGISDREQRRIGQDLHDGLCQLLTGTSFAVKALEEKLAANSATETGEVREIGTLLRRATVEARNVARGLHPVNLEAGGLPSALHELAFNVESLFNIRCTFHGEGPVGVEDLATAVHAYRIAQEAVNNALKHSHADHVTIRLAETNGAVTLTVTDNGIGYSGESSNGKGMGRNIMEYRARMIGGTLQIAAGHSGGTTVSLTFHKS